MKKLEQILAENLIRFKAKNLSEANITKLNETSAIDPLTKRITFPSGKWSEQGGNIDALLKPSLNEMQAWLTANKGYIVDVVLSASESYVPNYNGEVNPPTPLKAGALSKMRYSTIKTYMTRWLTGLQKSGAITTMPEIISKDPIISGPKWAPPANATSDQIKTLANSKEYTDAQYIEVTLKVLQDDSTIPLPEFAAVSTHRSPNAGTSDFNSTIYYNYSRAAAAVANLEWRDLPGSLLTMNRIIALRTDINTSTFRLPAFTANITPNGGKTYKVAITKSGVGFDKVSAGYDPKQWLQWDAIIAPSYKLDIPSFKVNTPEFEAAWLWLYWYIMNNFPADWNFISNKPKSIDFKRKLPSISSNNRPKQDGSLTKQFDIWNRKNLPNPTKPTVKDSTTPVWYATIVKKVLQQPPAVKKD